MGLDQFAFKVRSRNLESQKQDVDFNVDDIEKEELCYWRKHYDLDNWMQQRYRSKGGNDDMFNCCWMKLSKLDLTELEVCLLKGEIKYRDWPDELKDQLQRDFDFVDDAKKAIDNGYDVLYTNWW